MFKFLRLFGSRDHSDDADRLIANEAPPTDVEVCGAEPIALLRHITSHEGYPIMDWATIHSHVASIESDALQGRMWSAVERAWLLHLRAALGPRFRINETDHAMLLSSLEANVASATLDYMEKTLQRILRLLNDITQDAPWGKDILIVFDDDESYYRYVSFYYPDAGDFAFSGGMHIDAGCSHYVTVKNDLRVIEPIIAHEMTHGCLRHLPLPAWLNEGLAVNVERKLAPSPQTHTPQQLRARHLGFWGEAEIQEFWSGKSFLRQDDGNVLSYELACLLVGQMSQAGEPFKQFVLAADGGDAGAASAKQYLETDLGGIVCALLGRQLSPEWGPDPRKWADAPERGGFAKLLVSHRLLS
jgi:hypothetical protein